MYVYAGKTSLSMPIKDWIMLIMIVALTLTISIMTGIPRIYMIWMVLSILYIRNMYKEIAEYFDNTKKMYKKIERFKDIKWLKSIHIFLVYSANDLIPILSSEDKAVNAGVFDYNKDGLYVKNYTKFYSRRQYESRLSWTDQRGVVLSTFELCDIFIYRKYMIIDIVGNWIISSILADPELLTGAPIDTIIQLSRNYINTDYGYNIICDRDSFMKNYPQVPIDVINEYFKNNDMMDIKDYASYIFRNYPNPDPDYSGKSCWERLDMNLEDGVWPDPVLGLGRLWKDITLWEYLFEWEEGRITIEYYYVYKYRKSGYVEPYKVYI